MSLQPQLTPDNNLLALLGSKVIRLFHPRLLSLAVTDPIFLDPHNKGYSGEVTTRSFEFLLKELLKDGCPEALERASWLTSIPDTLDAAEQSGPEDLMRFLVKVLHQECVRINQQYPSPRPGTKTDPGPRGTGRDWAAMHHDSMNICIEFYIYFLYDLSGKWLGKDHGKREEAVIDTFVRFFKAIERGSSRTVRELIGLVDPKTEAMDITLGRRTKGLLKRILSHACTEILARTGREGRLYQGLEQDVPSPVPSGEEQLTHFDWLRAGIQQLDVKDRIPLVLHHYCGVSYSEMAALLQKKSEAIRVQNMRTRAKLEELIQCFGNSNPGISAQVT